MSWKGPTLGDDFPDLRGKTQYSNDFSLHEYLDDSWGIIFMHPDDFTPVCTTELGAAQHLKPEFDRRNVKMCGFSCNDKESHEAWIEDIAVATGAHITYPIFCDPERHHSVELGVLDPTNQDSKGMPVTVRSVYIIRPDKKIALTITYPASIGRNFDEILRVIDALQRADEYWIATPANWKPGDRTIVDFLLDDKQAEERFGKDEYEIVDLPSERSISWLKKHYLRYTNDPGPPPTKEEEEGAKILDGLIEGWDDESQSKPPSSSGPVMWHAPQNTEKEKQKKENSAPEGEGKDITDSSHSKQKNFFNFITQLSSNIVGKDGNSNAEVRKDDSVDLESVNSMFKAGLQDALNEAGKAKSQTVTKTEMEDAVNSLEKRLVHTIDERLGRIEKLLLQQHNSGLATDASNENIPYAPESVIDPEK